MKKIIIILGTIILGVYIVNNMLLGTTGSLKASSKAIQDNCSNEITTILTDKID